MVFSIDPILTLTIDLILDKYFSLLKYYDLFIQLNIIIAKIGREKYGILERVLHCDAYWNLFWREVSAISDPVCEKTSKIWIPEA